MTIKKTILNKFKHKIKSKKIKNCRTSFKELLSNSNAQNVDLIQCISGLCKQGQQMKDLPCFINVSNAITLFPKIIELILSTYLI